jgi:TRAP-type C4-dicarboxylate transport system permease small subunit
MKVLNDIVEKVFMFFGVLLLGVFILSVFLQVVARNYLHLPLLWTDEVAVMSFIWSVYLGAAVAVRHKKHYVVELFPESWRRTNTILNLVADISVFSLMYVMTHHGWTFAMMGFSRFSTAIGMPKAYFFLSVPVAGVAMILFGIEVLIADIGKTRTIFSGKADA